MTAMTKDTAAKERRSAHTRAVHPVGGRIVPEHNVFRGTVTLDPAGVHEAWSRLDVNTHAIEIAELPTRLHVDFLRALKRWSAHRTSNEH